MAPSENVREREVHRYYQPYRNFAKPSQYSGPANTRIANSTESDAIEVHNSGWSGYKPQLLADRALTSFAQLATLRLNCRRSIISLVDRESQLVLTEATRTLSLTRHTIDANTDDKIWLGSSIIAREGGISDHVFTSTYTVTDGDGSEFTGEGFVCSDMREHPYFKDRPYVVHEPHVVFYAGVPIKTRSGIMIGVYAVSNTEPRDGLTASEFRFMEDMADTVMYHLEMIRDREDRTKGERMVKGLAEFIEGSCALGRGVATAPTSNGITKSTSTPVPTSPTSEKPLNASSKVLERQTRNIRSMSDDHVPVLEAVSHVPGPKSIAKVVKPDASNPSCIFYRAADLMRRSTYADGVCFFRATGISLRSKVPEALSGEDTSFDDSLSPTSGSETANQQSVKQQHRFQRTPKFTTNKLKRVTSASTDKEEVKACEILGLSISEGVPAEEVPSTRNFVFSEQSMEKYIRKFPYGKFFSFSERGSGISSGDDKSEVEHPESSHKNGSNIKTRTKFIPTELLKILPGVRTLIFLPLWDPAAERWIAGGFIWTSQEGTLMSPHNELPYLRAFGNSITSEYARMNALIADKAKSDFISSISHELRSPLHGILGSVEFMNETDLSSYQNSLVSSVETCSKTLLETLEHILDYAKINKLYGRDRVARKAGTRKRETESSIMGPTADVDLNQVLEEVSESVCAGHAFRETHVVPGMQSDHEKIKNGCNLHRVSTSVEISPRLDQMVRTQPGAIRRIIMNLLGNSLKYTPDGYIAVILRSYINPADPTKVDVTMIFEDSGKGMSLEFQRTRLFSPFSQADPFSDGLGLGLSIVRQIVDSLGGHIEIRSEKDVGTVAKVHLTLPLTELPVPDDLQDIRAVTEGKRVVVVCPSSAAKRLAFCGRALETNSREWFGIEVINLPSGSDLKGVAADAILCPEVELQSNSSIREAYGIPLIVTCPNQKNQAHLRQHLLETLPPARLQGVQIVAQPLGPNKMGPIFKQIFSHTCSALPRLDRLSISQPLESVPELPKEESEDRPSTPIANKDRNGITHDATPVVEMSPRTKSSSSTAPVPAPPSPLRTKQSRPIPMRLQSGLAPESTSSVKNHVLLVDDNSINLKLLTLFMNKIGLKYAKASDGLQAFEEYKKNACSKMVSVSVASGTDSPVITGDSSKDFSEQLGTSPAESTSNDSSSSVNSHGSTISDDGHPFTWVLMDLSMPVMDGLESTRRIRAYERENKVKKAVIVALTGLASADAQQDALDAGVDFYLAKPVRFADLKKLMEV